MWPQEHKLLPRCDFHEKDWERKRVEKTFKIQGGATETWRRETPCKYLKKSLEHGIIYKPLKTTKEENPCFLLK